jgi:hypothetical protein
MHVRCELFSTNVQKAALGWSVSVERKFKHLSNVNLGPL